MLLYIDLTPLIEIFSYILLFFTAFTSFLYLLFLSIRERVKTKEIYPTISVIIPVHNGEKTIGKTLKSLLRMNYPKEKLEILVIDDGSTDKTAEIAKKFKEVKLFRIKHGGKARAVNYGIKKARGELVAILDDDTLVEKNILRKMVRFFADERVASVINGTHVLNPKNLWEKIQEIEYIITIFVRKILSKMDSLFVTPGTFTLYRKKIFDEIGYFDEKNLTEDLEIALRILSTKKYKIISVPKAKSYTIVPSTFSSLLKQRVRWNIGLIKNLTKYRFLFSKDYKNLGMFVLPSTIISFNLLIIFFSLVLLNLIIFFVQRAYILSKTGLEVFLINLFSFNPERFLTISFEVIYLYFVFFAFLFVSIFFARKIVGRNIPKLNFILYILTSSYLYYIFWIVSIYKLIKGEWKW
jgi:cellulose synthase/poly-beta-1,6-N-acetylglucosamine synthase-like glycosyltransferase